MIDNKYPIIAWFSAGVTSAVACKLALNDYSNVLVKYIDTGSHHPDNMRFLEDCQRWFNHSIDIHRSNKFNSVFDVIEKKRFINTAFGAPCTLELKKKVRYSIENELQNWEGQIFGFDFCKKEIHRAERFSAEYPNAKPIYPLIQHQLTKEDCLALIMNAGIKLPKMYLLGYKNNNCIGCVKGSMAYWNKIRNDFPSVFERMAQLERDINATCIRDTNGNVFLDELDPNRGKNDDPLIPECSLYCQLETLTL
ncbi:MAG: phosphoadenosine phosphosulfate reductase family protein [Bacteroidales bacterium]|nr:phosphoadenosine phosphosulfate reductase family protein [Bacteroidales bacterium]